MATFTLDLTDSELTMPNGEVVSVEAGEITLGFDPTWDDAADFQPMFRMVRLAAIDSDGNRVRLALPVSHPAIRELLTRRESDIAFDLRRAA